MILDLRYGFWLMPIPGHPFYQQIRIVYDDLCVADETGCLDSGLL
jgi:hypothetical protein